MERLADDGGVCMLYTWLASTWSSASHRIWVWEYKRKRLGISICRRIPIWFLCPAVPDCLRQKDEMRQLFQGVLRKSNFTSASNE